MNKMKNPIAKEVRTPKYKSQIIDNKKIYNRKKVQNKEELFGQKENEELEESYKESRRQTKERTTGPLDSFSKDLKDIINKKRKIER
tara:strand:- start:3447 stop:3707 length:261 start_codon:yes stop_codon:yes gene_type:complete